MSWQSGQLKQATTTHPAPMMATLTFGWAPVMMEGRRRRNVICQTTVIYIPHVLVGAWLQDVNVCAFQLRPWHGEAGILIDRSLDRPEKDVGNHKVH